MIDPFKRATLLFLLIISLCSAQELALKNLAASLSSQVKEHGKGPVAITSFTNIKYCPLFSGYLIDRLNIFMAKGNTDFDIVTRDRVEELFKQNNLKLGRDYDSSTFARAGKQLGAKSVVAGSYIIQEAAATVSIAAQILDVETGRIIGGDVAEIPYSGDIKSMLDPQACMNGTSASFSHSAEPSSSNQRRREERVGQLKVALQSCKINARGTLCEVLVTNIGDEQKYCIYRNEGDVMSRIIDDAGNVSTASAMQLGDANDAWNACAELPNGVPVKGSLLFQDGRLVERQLALLEIVFDFPPHIAYPMPAGSRPIPTSLNVQFQNVSVVR